MKTEAVDWFRQAQKIQLKPTNERRDQNENSQREIEHIGSNKKQSNDRLRVENIEIVVEEIFDVKDIFAKIL